MPPAFIVIRPRAIDRRPWRHLSPSRCKCAIESGHVQFQSDFFADERVMMSDASGQIKERPDGIKKDRFRLWFVAGHQACSMESGFRAVQARACFGPVEAIRARTTIDLLDSTGLSRSNFASVARPCVFLVCKTSLAR